MLSSKISFKFYFPEALITSNRVIYTPFKYSRNLNLLYLGTGHVFSKLNLARVFLWLYLLILKLQSSLVISSGCFSRISLSALSYLSFFGGNFGFGILWYCAVSIFTGLYFLYLSGYNSCFSKFIQVKYSQTGLLEKSNISKYLKDPNSIKLSIS